MSSIPGAKDSRQVIGGFSACLAPLFHAFNSRSRWASVWQLGFWSNARLWAAFVLALGLQAIAVYVPGAHLVFDTEPLPAATALALLGSSASVWVIGELH